MAGGLNRYSYAGSNPVSNVDPFGRSWSTFKDGLVEGGITGFYEGLKYGMVLGVIGASVAASDGALLMPILLIFLGVKAAQALIDQIIELFTLKMCTDELHRRIGFLLGSIIGALMGGVVGGVTAAGAVAEMAPAPKAPPPPEPKLGGAYRDVPAQGGEIHHMPADSVSPLSKGSGPGIRMETPDHMETASWGRSHEAQAYRAQQQSAD